MKKNILVDKTIALYSNLGWKSLFAKIRMWDAPYLEVEKLLPKSGNIIDLGCGEGLFSNYIALASSKRKVFGVDIDKNRINQAQRGLKNTRFMYGDATRIKIPPADVVVMFHLLHHLESRSNQDKVLKDFAKKIKKNSKLIIVEVEPKMSIKYLAAWFTDHLLVPWLFEKKIYSPAFFRSSKDWQRLLKSLGFKCQIISAEKDYPFSHVILNCSKVD